MEDSSGAVFAALADPTRRRLLALLSERGGASATELAREVPVTRQAVVKHLEVLRDASLVVRARQGRAVVYRPSPAPLEDAVTWMASVGAEWDDRLAALRRQLGAVPRA